MKTLVKEQITLVTKSVNEFQSNIKNLSNNQRKIEKQVNEIEEYIHTSETDSLSTYWFFYVELAISQIIAELEIMYDILEKLQIAITFSKLNTFHNSIIDPKELLDEIKGISIYLTENKIPFDPKPENILHFEEMINIKSYSNNNQIVFILEIPIVEKAMYNYFHLYSVPMLKDNNNFLVIIPQSKFLIINEQNHISFDNKCKEIIPGEFICQESNTLQSNEKAPCEVQLLKNSGNLSNCQPVPATLSLVKIQKIGNNKWIVITPRPTLAIQQCGNERTNVFPYGSYLLELNPNCFNSEAVCGVIVVEAST
ncbi:uncharacterized protein [Euwallacea fornicatus]|uniref:uncharacterized protein n=1 Tax=Euwallacea fornicatus TaxID=995702 RepID=UPI00338D3BB8